MKKGTLFFRIAVISFLIIGVLGCSNSKEETGSSVSEKSSGPLVMKMIHTEPQSFFPPDQGTANELILYQLVYEQLGRYDEKGNTKPFLAEDFIIDPASKTITIVVRDGVEFSDGTVCDGEAIKWNFEKWMEAGRNEFGKPEITVNSDGNVVCKWDQWRNNILAQIAARVIASPTAYEKGGATEEDRKIYAKSHPVGTGPFMLGEWVPASSLTFVKNPNYRMPGKPMIDEIYIIPQPDQTIAKTQFLSGDVDLYAPTDSSVSKELQDMGYVNEAIQFPAATRALIPNSKDKTVTVNGAKVDNPLYDPEIRKAVSFGLDRNALVAALSFGIDAPSTQWIDPSVSAYVKELDDIRGYDVEAAKKIMSSKGYSDSNLCKIALWTTSQNLPFATAVQGMLREIFIDIELKIVQYSEIAQMMGVNGDAWEGMIVQLTGIYINPLDYYGIVFSDSPTQYVKGIDRTQVITRDKLPSEYAEYAGMTMPELLNYSLTTAKGDSLESLKALTYYIGYEDLLIGTMAFGSNLFSSERLTGFGRIGIQWTPEEMKIDE